MANPNERRPKGIQRRIRLSLVSPNVQFSGRAPTCHARRRRTMATPRLRRARDAVTRCVATALTDDLVILGVGPDPEPRDTVRDGDTQAR
jgi:hypothetical protein